MAAVHDLKSELREERRLVGKRENPPQFQFFCFGKALFHYRTAETGALHLFCHGHAFQLCQIIPGHMQCAARNDFLGSIYYAEIPDRFKKFVKTPMEHFVSIGKHGDKLLKAFDIFNGSLSG